MEEETKDIYQTADVILLIIKYEGEIEMLTRNSLTAGSSRKGKKNTYPMLILKKPVN